MKSIAYFIDRKNESPKKNKSNCDCKLHKNGYRSLFLLNHQHGKVSIFLPIKDRSKRVENRFISFNHGSLGLCDKLKKARSQIAKEPTKTFLNGI